MVHPVAFQEGSGAAGRRAQARIAALAAHADRGAAVGPLRLLTAWDGRSLPAAS